VVLEIRAAIGDLRSRLDAAIGDLRAEIGGRRKSHYSVEEVAELTGRAAYTVRTWIKEGLIVATRVHGTGPRGRLLVPRDELLKLVERGQGTQVPSLVID
jgi:excisionase family DNA binding protein